MSGSRRVGSRYLAPCSLCLKIARQKLVKHKRPSKGVLTRGDTILVKLALQELAWFCVNSGFGLPLRLCYFDYPNNCHGMASVLLKFH